MKEQSQNDISRESLKTIQHGNVLDFKGMLQGLRQKTESQHPNQAMPPHSSAENSTVRAQTNRRADTSILDAVAPTWAHSIQNIKRVGNLMAVTAAVTIAGVTREGIGTGAADSEMGIKTAEDDALTRAMAKFGIARGPVQNEFRNEECGESKGGSIENLHMNPIATSFGELISAAQLGMIRAISREAGLDSEEECYQLLGCGTIEMSKSAGTVFIRHLQQKQQQRNREMQTGFSLAG